MGRVLEPGMEIGGFTLRERMHAGSMASLWSVGRAGDATPLVMKLPRVRDGDDPAAIVGFEVEQMILPRLSGPHVPRFVAAAGFDAPQPFIVMELVDSPTLRARLDDAPLPAAEVAALGARVAEALHDLHRQHVSHLDLKPSQVLWRPGGEAVLIDYGLSRHDRLPDLLAEEFRLPMGTGPYISPEQVRGVRDDPRSDLFALGVMLYHLATGERPFGFPQTVQGLRKRLWRDALPPRAHVPDLPPWLQEVILGCLEVDPARRWQTAAQIALHLSRLAEEFIIWASQPFGFVTLPDALSTGSSIMPQKKNPDAAELVRGHAGRIVGSLTSLMITMKGLPLAYSKDMQDDKPPVFEAAGLLTLCLAAMEGMVAGATFRTQRMRAAAELGYATATDLADWLVRQAGIPFREAHHITGAAVKLAESRGVALDALPLADLQAIDARIDERVFAALSVDASVASRASYGGTAPEQVRLRVAEARGALGLE